MQITSVHVVQVSLVLREVHTDKLTGSACDGDAVVHNSMNYSFIMNLRRLRYQMMRVFFFVSTAGSLPAPLSLCSMRQEERVHESVTSPSLLRFSWGWRASHLSTLPCSSSPRPFSQPLPRRYPSQRKPHSGHMLMYEAESFLGDQSCCTIVIKLLPTAVLLYSCKSASYHSREHPRQQHRQPRFHSTAVMRK